MKAFSDLVSQKDFHSITTAQIARDAGVTEGLIYKYFSDKKDLLYQVLDEHFYEFQAKLKHRVDNETGAIRKLDVIIYSSLESYAENRILSKILLLEVRNAEPYFTSSAYKRVQKYARTILDIIEQGRKDGELRDDIDSKSLRKVILGTIEHACLGEIIFGRDVDIDRISSDISTILFNGARRHHDQ